MIFNIHTFTKKSYTESLDKTTGLFSKSVVSSTLTGTVQPATPDMLEMLPEAERTKKAILVVSESPLYEQDVITWNGEDYKIVYVDDFSDMNLIEISFYQATALRI